MDLKYLQTRESISVVIDGRPYSISKRHPSFGAIAGLVRENADPAKVLGEIQSSARFVRGIVDDALRRRKITGTIEYVDGMILHNGEPLQNYAVDTLLKLFDLGHDVGALAAFIERQQANPDPVVHEELYKFLEFGKIPLTPDGHFLVYKAVRQDYRDIHSGSFDNSVGARPRLSGREAVDPNRHNTCSRGLHVCSFGYLPHFASANGHVMLCKVDPADVVAIPSDYNNTKMRVIGYEVVGEVTSYYSRGEDVVSFDRLASLRYEVHYSDDTASAVAQIYDTFYTLDEAKAAADALDATHAWVIDTHKNEEVVYES